MTVSLIWQTKWLHPHSGQYLISIGNDLKLKLWEEDPTQAESSGRRFRNISTITNGHGVPFVSVAVKHVTPAHLDFVATIDRLGELTLFEPATPDRFTELSVVDKVTVVSTPPQRWEETSFCISFDPNPVPVPYALGLTDDQKMVSLAVTALDSVKIYRSIVDSSSQGAFSSGPRIRLCQVAALPIQPAIIRSVSWAPGSVRGYDLIATGCGDGAVRIYKLETGKIDDENNTTQHYQASRVPQSSLTSAIAGRSNSISGHISAQVPVSPFKETVTELMADDTAHHECWNVTWNSAGRQLASGGDDGVDKIWAQGVESEDQWMLAAEIQAREMTDEEE
ncbi:MAG: hypothetical protein Q9227_008684 [Pyrenula ochraceoflavens]